MHIITLGVPFCNTEIHQMVLKTTIDGMKYFFYLSYKQVLQKSIEGTPEGQKVKAETKNSIPVSFSLKV